MFVINARNILPEAFLMIMLFYFIMHLFSDSFLFKLQRSNEEFIDLSLQGKYFDILL